MKIPVLGLVVLLGAFSIPISSAMSYTDDSSMENAIEETVFKTLDNTGYFYHVETEVEWGNALDIWYIPENFNPDSARITLAYIIGSYWNACKNYPDLSDLNIMMGTKNVMKGKMNCKREWIDEVRGGSKGNLNKTGEDLLIMRVLDTFKDTSEDNLAY